VKIALLFFLLSFNLSLSAQFISASDTINLCSSETATLVASEANISSSLINDDDVHSEIIDIGFDFTFYGNTYSQCVLSANGYITFDIGLSGLFSPFEILDAIPNIGQLPENAIMAPWHDIDPSVGGNVVFGTYGIAPNRVFYVVWCNTPMYLCNNLIANQYVLMFEGSNKIEMHIDEKPLCSSWNNGAAVQGLVNENSTLFEIVNDPILLQPRNYPLNWTAFNEGWSFIPNANFTDYTINSITYNPITTGTIEWTDQFGSNLGDSSELIVAPDSNSVYYISVVDVCTGETISNVDSVFIQIIDCNIDEDLTKYSCLDCQFNSSQLYQVVSTNSNSPSQIYNIDLLNLNINELASSPSEFQINAVGMNTSDSLAYGIKKSSNELIRIDALGNTTNLGVVNGLPLASYDSGDFGSDDILHVTGNANDIVYKIDVQSISVIDNYLLSEPINTADFCLNPVDSLFYSVVGNGDFVSINPNNGTVNIIGNTGLTGPIGAMYSDETGRVYGMQNSTGNMYEINVFDASINLITTLSSVTYNDGYSCRKAINTNESFFSDVSACNSFVINGVSYTESGLYTNTYTNSFGCDSVVTLDLTINETTFGTDIQTHCDSYTWIDGNTYSASNNTATHTLTNSNGCDSIVTLDLTILQSTFGTDIQTHCDSYTWIDGNTYSSSNNTATHTLTNSNGCDSLVTLDLTILQSTFGTDVQTHCDSYTWIDGNTYSASNNTATHSLTNSNGCDSIVTLDLTINETTFGTDVQTHCDSYTWIDGNTYSASNNTATHSLTNSNGCDSIVTLDLTINETTFGTDVQTHCDSYTWIDGNTYSASNNTATHSLTNSNGCDSIVTLDLTILQSTFGTDVQTHCDSYTWIDGNIYSSSNNTATHSLTNSNGCDSIVTLDLTILQSTFGTDVQTHCDSYTWIDGNTYSSSNNTATHTLTNSNGCDSIVTLDLTILQSTFGTDVQTHCDSYTWIDGNIYSSSNNTATHTLTNSNGCDSIVTLDLTILQSTFGTDVQTHCDSYTWIDGNTYSSSNNTATHTLTNSIGCDSIVTLDLTILQSTFITDVQTHCDSYTWIDGNTYSSSNNTATHTLTNSIGCDSIVTLDLTILQSTFITDVQTHCDSYTWIDGNTYSSSNNTATHTLTNSIGCDSTILLNLKLIKDLSYLPNIFTPNNDLKNEIYSLVTTQEFDNYELSIFNRWGDLIFVTEDINQGWDGTFNGVNCMNGVYAYKVKLFCADKKIVKTGSFSLLR
jgi:gliding motility-associated-like protein